MAHPALLPVSPIKLLIGVSADAPGSSRKARCMPSLVNPDPVICPALLIPQAMSNPPPNVGSGVAGDPRGATNATRPLGSLLTPTTVPSSLMPNAWLNAPEIGARSSTPDPSRYRNACVKPAGV
jgi:hypothetical protein